MRDESQPQSDDLAKESRSVWALRFPHGQYTYEVGHNEVTAIQPIEVTGQMAYVPWFNVWRGQTLACKVNAAHVAVVLYAPEN